MASVASSAAKTSSIPAGAVGTLTPTAVAAAQSERSRAKIPAVLTKICAFVFTKSASKHERGKPDVEKVWLVRCKYPRCFARDIRPSCLSEKDLEERVPRVHPRLGLSLRSARTMLAPRLLRIAKESHVNRKKLQHLSKTYRCEGINVLDRRRFMSRKKVDKNTLFHFISIACEEEQKQLALELEV